MRPVDDAELFADRSGDPRSVIAHYARAGLSVFPVHARTKEPPPGYLWKERATSNVAHAVEDADEAAARWGGAEVSVAWACGLDGYLAVDLDAPDEPDWWAELRGHCAVNTTRRGEHLVAPFPDGMTPSNSTAGFPTQGWGEARGAGGYIVIAGPDRPGFDERQLAGLRPFPHPDWLREAESHAEPVTSSEAEEFEQTNTAATFPAALKGPLKMLDEWRTPGPGRQASRHNTARDVACWMAREAAAGLYPADEAFDRLRAWWADVIDDTRRRNGRELDSIIRWAIAQVTPERVAEVKAKHDTGLESLVAANADPTSREAVPGVPEEFWTARPVLEHIRQAARARRVAPTTVLGCVLARVAGFTPPTVAIPPLVGSAVPLSTYVAVMSPTGGAKSAPMAVAHDLIPVTAEGVAGPLPLGSGEGLANAYLDVVDDLDDDGKKVRVRRQTRHGALFTLDEARVLAEMAGRRGATIVPTLCTAWTGGDLGQANAGADTFRHVPARGYALGIIAAWQPSHAEALFDDTDGGLPGRFLFLPTADTDAPAERPDWPGRLDWLPPSFCRWSPTPGDLAHVTTGWLDVAGSIVAEVDAERLAILRGEQVPHPLDAHRTLKRLKVAGVLAVLDDRPNVTEEDWQLSGTLVALSDAVRDSVLGHLRAEAHRREQAATDKAVRRAEALAESAEGRAFRAAARAMARKAHRQAGEVLPRRLLTQAVKGSDRALVDLDRVLDHCIDEGWLEAADDGYTAGRSTPA